LQLGCANNTREGNGERGPRAGLQSGFTILLISASSTRVRNLKGSSNYVCCWQTVCRSLYSSGRRSTRNAFRIVIAKRPGGEISRVGNAVSSKMPFFNTPSLSATRSIINKPRRFQRDSKYCLISHTSRSGIKAKINGFPRGKPNVRANIVPASLCP